ncbi:unnamed protein product, partial [Urochloa humidicola]
TREPIAISRVFTPHRPISGSPFPSPSPSIHHRATPTPMASSAAGAGKSLFQGLRRFLKKPWEITGPCASPEYLSALPGALEYRVKCPATVRDDRDRAIVPTSDPETVYDIKYFTRDRRRNRPPVRRTLLRKPDLERYMAAKQFDPTKDFPVPYVNTTVEEDDNTIGGGYQK